ncbi:hypothetical protein Tco_1456149, partial [Tanacetum coccineum]
METMAGNLRNLHTWLELKKSGIPRGQFTFLQANIEDSYVFHDAYCTYVGAVLYNFSSIWDKITGFMQTVLGVEEPRARAELFSKPHEHRPSLLPPDLEHRNKLGRPDLQQHQAANTYSLIYKKHIDEVAAPERFQFWTLTGKGPSLYANVVKVCKICQAIASLSPAACMILSSVDLGRDVMLQIGLACVARVPDMRPSMNDVIKMIADLRSLDPSGHQASLEDHKICILVDVVAPLHFPCFAAGSGFAALLLPMALQYGAC